MKQLLDFIPLIIFFVLYKMQDIYVATGALIIATAVQVAVTYWLYKTVEKMQLITFAMVAVFGGMTLFFHDDNFIKWKVTIVYALFAIALAVTHAMGRGLIKGMLGKEITLPERVWAKVNFAWVVFFSFCAGLNIYVPTPCPLIFGSTSRCLDCWRQLCSLPCLLAFTSTNTCRKRHPTKSKIKPPKMRTKIIHLDHRRIFCILRERLRISDLRVAVLFLEDNKHDKYNIEHS